MKVFVMNIEIPGPLFNRRTEMKECMNLKTDPQKSSNLNKREKNIGGKKPKKQPNKKPKIEPQELWNNTKRFNICVIRVSQGKQKEYNAEK